MTEEELEELKTICKTADNRDYYEHGYVDADLIQAFINKQDPDFKWERPFIIS